VALVDADLRLAARDRRDDAYVRRHVEDMYRTFARELGVVQKLDAEALAVEAAELARRIVRAEPSARSRTSVDWIRERGHLAGAVSPALLERYFALFEAHLDLVEGFRPPALEAPVELWTSAESGGERAGPWRAAIRGGVRETTLAASHYELMYPPHVERI